MYNLRLTNDFVFKYVFGRENCHVQLTALLEAILNRKVEDVAIELDTTLEADFLDDKVGIVDIKASLTDPVSGNRERVSIEMQILNEYNIVKRTLFYWSKLYTSELKKGNNYDKLKKTVTINIIDFTEKKLLKPHSIFHMLSDYEYANPKESLFSDEVEIHFIQLKKFEDPSSIEELEEDLLMRWVTFLKGDHDEWVIKMSEKDKAVKEAVGRVKYLSEDESARRRAELREKYILDYNSGMDGAREKGREIGLEEGRKEGRKEGRDEVRRDMIITLIESHLEKGLTHEEAFREVASLLKLKVDEIVSIHDQLNK